MQNEEQQQPFYFWAENLEEYESDNLAYDKGKSENPVIEIKRLNFFIGKNNEGKSRFLRKVFSGVLLANTDRDLDSKRFKFTKISSILQELEKSDEEYLSKYTENLLNPHKTLENSFYDALFPHYCLHGSKRQSSRKIIQMALDEFDEKINPHRHKRKDRKNKDILDRQYNIIRKISNETIPEKYYIPILRNMRPVQSKQIVYPYRNRTQQDYFADKEHIDIENILTGENLYTHIQQQLLGKPQRRQTIQKYQEKLSQYFFNNLEVTLIPELESDMLCIKIGEDEQLPVAQLGDGLQQVIILTYHAFIQQDAVCSFFIEEPELHMHPGMLRQLMNFYLNETKHYYFFTTHSNHLLDMADESNEVMIQKFVKKSPDQFHIYRCGRDRDLLQSLGVRPSSVYLANCTIWVEGITDRLYLAKYMEKYFHELKQSDVEAYHRYRRFMPNYHYAFVEYSGGNIVHWYFGEEFVSQNQDKGMNAKAVVSDMLLIADGDNLGKAKRVEGWTRELEQNVYILPCKEIENTLPYDVIISVAKALFKTKQGFDIKKLDSINCSNRDNFFFNQEKGIGGILDDVVRENGTKVDELLFSASGVGTIAKKLQFCHAVLKEMDNLGDNWQLTPSARDLCERIFQHIERNNDEAQ